VSPKLPPSKRRVAAVLYVNDRLLPSSHLAPTQYDQLPPNQRKRRKQKSESSLRSLTREMIITQDDSDFANVLNIKRGKKYNNVMSIRAF